MAHREELVQRDHRHERSLGELFSELSHDTSTLLRKEVELAKAEIRQQASQAAADAAGFGAGGALLYAGLLAVIAAVSLIVIRLGVVPWLAVLLTGLVTIAVGYGLIQSSRNKLKHRHVVPRRAARQAKETVEWAKEQVS